MTDKKRPAAKRSQEPVGAGDAGPPDTRGEEMTYESRIIVPRRARGGVAPEAPAGDTPGEQPTV